jgi:hypothetical protein
MPISPSSRHDQNSVFDTVYGPGQVRQHATSWEDVRSWRSRSVFFKVFRTAQCNTGMHIASTTSHSHSRALMMNSSYDHVTRLPSPPLDLKPIDRECFRVPFPSRHQSSLTHSYITTHPPSPFLTHPCSPPFPIPLSFNHSSSRPTIWAACSCVTCSVLALRCSFSSLKRCHRVLRVTAESWLDESEELRE